MDNIVSRKDKVRDVNRNQLKLEVQDSCKKDEKLTPNSKSSTDENVLNEAYLGEKLLKKMVTYLCQKKTTANL